MPLVPEPKLTPRKAAGGVEPLRRRRVAPEPVVSPRGRRLLNVVLGFATVVVLVDALVGDKGLAARLRANKEYQQQVTAVERLKAKNAELRQQAASLRDDPAAIEAIAREELGLIREGEMLFILRDVRPAREVRSSLADPGAAAAEATHYVK